MGSSGADVNADRAGSVGWFCREHEHGLKSCERGKSWRRMNIQVATYTTTNSHDDYLLLPNHQTFHITSSAYIQQKPQSCRAPKTPCTPSHFNHLAPRILIHIQPPRPLLQRHRIPQIYHLLPHPLHPILHDTPRPLAPLPLLSLPHPRHRLRLGPQR
jgi:hypothetical protein